MRFLALSLVATMHCVSASATPDHYSPKKLTGSYSIGTSSLTDPAPEEKDDELLRLYLTGEAAKDLYASLHSKPKRDECFDDGTITKVAGNLVCAKHPKGTHECWFGVDLKRQALAPGFVC